MPRRSTVSRGSSGSSRSPPDPAGVYLGPRSRSSAPSPSSPAGAAPDTPRLGWHDASHESVPRPEHAPLRSPAVRGHPLRALPAGLRAGLHRAPLGDLRDQRAGGCPDRGEHPASPRARRPAALPRRDSLLQPVLDRQRRRDRRPRSGSRSADGRALRRHPPRRRPVRPNRPASEGSGHHRPRDPLPHRTPPHRACPRRSGSRRRGAGTTARAQPRAVHAHDEVREEPPRRHQRPRGGHRRHRRPRRPPCRRHRRGGGSCEGAWSRRQVGHHARAADRAPVPLATHHPRGARTHHDGFEVARQPRQRARQWCARPRDRPPAGGAGRAARLRVARRLRHRRLDRGIARERRRDARATRPGSRAQRPRRAARAAGRRRRRGDRRVGLVVLQRQGARRDLRRRPERDAAVLRGRERAAEWRLLRREPALRCDLRRARRSRRLPPRRARIRGRGGGRHRPRSLPARPLHPRFQARRRVDELLVVAVRAARLPAGRHQQPQRAEAAGGREDAAHLRSRHDPVPRVRARPARALRARRLPPVRGHQRVP